MTDPRDEATAKALAERAWEIPLGYEGRRMDILTALTDARRQGYEEGQGDI